MVTTLEQLYTKHKQAFRLQLAAGRLNGQNIVDWIYMLEDENITPYLNRGALLVTTGARMVRNPNWLKELILRLIEIKASGLIVNTGMYIHRIPQDVLDLCNEHNFVLMTMPWEIRITEMTQTLCMTIIDNQQEILLHDQALATAILHPETDGEYREILGRYYDLNTDFTVLAVHAIYRENMGDDIIFTPSREMAYRLERRIRRLRTPAAPELHICWIHLERYQLLIINHALPDTVNQVRDLVLDVYREIEGEYDVYVGIGTREPSLEDLPTSFRNALSALRLAERKKEPVMDFNALGYYRLLLSCRTPEIPFRYADELLAPVDALGDKAPEYLELLDTYIRCDRSLEHTAQELFLHRNTVNYRMNKLRNLLNSPLKTVEDLLPYRLALSIRELDR